MTLPEKIRELRQRTGLSQEEVCAGIKKQQRVVLDRKLLSGWERGYRGITVPNLVVLIKYYQQWQPLTADDLIFDDRSLWKPAIQAIKLSPKRRTASPLR